jgi:hypothetical protein
MGHQGVVQVAQHRATLRARRLHRRPDPLHETAALRTVAAEGVLPPRRARRSSRPAWLFVDSASSVTTNRYTAGTNASRFAHRTPPPSHPRSGIRVAAVARTPAPGRRGGSAAPPAGGAAAEQVPLLEHPPLDAQQRPPQLRRRPRSTNVWKSLLRWAQQTCAATPATCRTPTRDHRPGSQSRRCPTAP